MNSALQSLARWRVSNYKDIHSWRPLILEARTWQRQLIKITCQEITLSGLPTQTPVLDQPKGSGWPDPSDQRTLSTTFLLLISLRRTQQAASFYQRIKTPLATWYFLWRPGSFFDNRAPNRRIIKDIGIGPRSDFLWVLFRVVSLIVRLFSGRYAKQG